MSDFFYSRLRGFLCVAQLTELKALLGCVGQTRFVMGAISQLQDGRYFLEDLSDALPIDLSEAQTTSGFFTGTPVLHHKNYVRLLGCRTCLDALLACMLCIVSKLCVI